MFKKDKKKEKISLLEEVDDIYLGESAGISKVGSATGTASYVQPDMFAAFNSGYSRMSPHNTGIYTKRKLF
jgi:hypothetical protein